MKKQNELGDLYYHEILDRSFCLMDSFYEHIMGHPAVEAHQELSDLAQETFDAMQKFYNTCGGYPKA
jgi:hypothetical protein